MKWAKTDASHTFAFSDAEDPGREHTDEHVRLHKGRQTTSTGSLEQAQPRVACEDSRLSAYGIAELTPRVELLSVFLEPCGNTESSSSREDPRQRKREVAEMQNGHASLQKLLNIAAAQQATVDQQLQQLHKQQREQLAQAQQIQIMQHGGSGAQAQIVSLAQAHSSIQPSIEQLTQPLEFQRPLDLQREQLAQARQRQQGQQLALALAQAAQLEQQAQAARAAAEHSRRTQPSIEQLTEPLEQSGTLNKVHGKQSAVDAHVKAGRNRESDKAPAAAQDEGWLGKRDFSRYELSSSDVVSKRANLLSK